MYNTITAFIQSWERLLENMVRKGNNAGYQFFPFSLGLFFSFYSQIWPFQQYLICCLPMLSIWTNQNFCCQIEVLPIIHVHCSYLNIFNRFPNKPLFYVSAVQVFREGKKKTWEKDNLQRAISPFPTLFSTRLENF